MNQFFQRYAALKDYEPDENEVFAGIERLAMFGDFGTIVSLARKTGQTYQTIANMAADEVYMTLLYDLEMHKYEKNLLEIKKKLK